MTANDDNAPKSPNADLEFQTAEEMGIENFQGAVAAYAMRGFPIQVGDAVRPGLAVVIEMAQNPVHEQVWARRALDVITGRLAIPEDAVPASELEEALVWLRAGAIVAACGSVPGGLDAEDREYLSDLLETLRVADVKDLVANAMVDVPAWTVDKIAAAVERILAAVPN